MMDTEQGALTCCPDSHCSSTAEVYDRQLIDSTDGPTEIARIQCLQGHRFFMPTERLL